MFTLDQSKSIAERMKKSPLVWVRQMGRKLSGIEDRYLPMTVEALVEEMKIVEVKDNNLEKKK